MNGASEAGGGGVSEGGWFGVLGWGLQGKCVEFLRVSPSTFSFEEKQLQTENGMLKIQL